MAQLTIHNLDDATRDRLRAQAAAHGRSLEDEARHILHESVFSSASVPGKLGAWCLAQFSDEALAEDFLENRGFESPRPAAFD